MKLLVAGEAWGEEEERQNAPFVGPSGRYLHVLFKQAGLPPLKHCHLTNVFNKRPRPTNDIKNLCGPKGRGVPGTKPLYGKYVLPDNWHHVERFRDEVSAVKPNLVLALGNTALWALVRGNAKISAARGTIFESFLTHPDGEPIKVLPTYHPAAVLREDTLRPVVLADLQKASRELEFREIRRPNRTLWIEPNLNDIEQFYHSYIVPNREQPWGVDIETRKGTITEIGFAMPHLGLVVPFYSRARINYWPTHEEEKAAWLWVKQILAELRKPVFHNGLYDLNYIFRMGITVPYAGEDTMLLHHSLQPEIKKGLGFLGSIYTNEPMWKDMRDKAADEYKRED